MAIFDIPINLSKLDFKYGFRSSLTVAIVYYKSIQTGF